MSAWWNRGAAPRALVALAARSAPSPFAAAMVITLAAAVVPSLFFVATGRVVAGVIDAAGGAGQDGTALRWLVASGALFVVQQALGPLRQLATADLGYRLEQAVRNRIMAASLGPIGIRHLDDPAVNDEMARARGIATGQVGPLVGIIAFFNLASRYCAATGAAVVLASWKWWLGALLALTYIVIGRVGRRVFREVLDAVYGAVPSLRRSDYFRELALRSDMAKEVRVFGLTDWIVGRFSAAWTGAMADIWRSRASGRWRVVRAVGLQTVVKFAAFAYLARLAARGDVHPGMAATIAQAMNGVAQYGALGQEDLMLAQGASAIPAAVSLPDTVAQTELRFADTARDPAGLPQQSIRFEGVAFAYPRSTSAVYESLDLEIRAGQSLAIVGVNGAGKTTLVKLLARLYDPDRGRITVDGIDLRDLDSRAWQRRLAAIFQDFVRYHLPVSDNIGLGALHLEGDHAAMERSAARAGATEIIERLPDGWSTTLSRELSDGAELSGGEWQRIALARALMAVEGGAGVLILDEPTANLDVRAEAALYDRFLDLTQGLTSIIISHRFSTVRRADRIVVLEHGRVVEDGTHETLIALQGRYATMFGLQASRFTEQLEAEDMS